MTSLLQDSLTGQIEIFEALEMVAANDYGVIERELINPRFKKIIGAIRIEEIHHAKLCREIIEFLKK